MPSARLVYVLSPAKTLDLSASRVSQCSQPRLLSDAHELVEQLQKLSQVKVKSLLGVSDALAKLNLDRFQAFDVSKTATEATSPSGTLKQAALALNGPAYQGLEAQSLSETDLEFSQTHLRILCGLYGVLRPLDLIQPYRLEMGQKFENKRGKDLYEFWGDTIVSELDALFKEEEAKEDVKLPRILANVASQEYFKSLPSSALKAAGISVVDCVFKDDGKIKSVYAKRARGLMCRYLIQNRVDSVEGITGFDLEGYKYASSASSDETFVFTRTATELQKMKEKAATKTKTNPSAKYEVVNVEKKELEGDNDAEERPVRRSTRKKRKTV
ncbi:Peroxide stress protein YaaA [Phytophthora infestans]|uniref:Peroxide stress protein YaaA n=1 Tax=Phytophthora infestans TaxID=4787 RepID=A0A8S9U2B5_PHYIN|nr:Peroxide stress protein YaaA [Phytophthora infestans]